MRGFRRMHFIALTALVAALPTAAFAQTCGFLTLKACFSGFTTFFIGTTTTTTTTNTNVGTISGTILQTGTTSLQTSTVPSFTALAPNILATSVVNLTATGATIGVSTDVATSVTVTYSAGDGPTKTATATSPSVAPYDTRIPLLLLLPDTTYNYSVSVRATNGVTDTASGKLNFTTLDSRTIDQQVDPSRVGSPPEPPTAEELFTLALDKLADIPSGTNRLLCKGERETLRQGGLLPAGGRQINFVKLRATGTGTSKRILLNTAVYGVIDADADGLRKAEEDANGTSDANADTDGDGKDDCTEIYVTATNPKVRD